MQSAIRFFKDALLDSSFWAVLLGNVISIYLAITQKWPLGEIMWVYWFQSIIIGATNVWRMAALKKFSTKDLKMNDQPIPETPEGKWSLIAFFIAHYGIFHFIYAGFLWGSISPAEIPPVHVTTLMLSVISFILAHTYSLRRNIEDDLKEPTPNIGTLMMFPYFRIFPMHFTILFGGILAGGTFEIYAVLFFMGLKTLADVGMHVAEHKILRGELNLKQRPDRADNRIDRTKARDQ